MFGRLVNTLKTQDSFARAFGGGSALNGCDDLVDRLLDSNAWFKERLAQNREVIDRLAGAFGAAGFDADRSGRAGALILGALANTHGLLRNVINDKTVLEMDPEARGFLFDCIAELNAADGWPVSAAIYARFFNHDRVEPPHVLAMFLEALRMNLIVAGFPITEKRASTLLDLFARDAAPVEVKSAYDRDYVQDRLGIFKDIAKAADKGEITLSAEDHANGRKILDLAFTDPDNKKVEALHLQDTTFIKALRAIAGTGEQEPFFDRMMAIPPVHVPHVALADGWEELAPLYDAALDEAARIRKEITAYRDASTMPPENWIDDRKGFEKLFGAPVKDDPRTHFGWWHRDTQKETGFSEYGNNRLNNFLTGKIETLAATITPQRAAAYRQMIVDEVPTWPWDVKTKGLAAAHLFRLDGADPQGELLNHLASVGDGKPTASWRKRMAALANEKGRDKVVAGLEAWLGEMARDEHPDVALPDLLNMQDQGRVFTDNRFNWRIGNSVYYRLLRWELEEALALEGDARRRKIRMIGLLLAGGLRGNTSEWTEEMCRDPNRVRDPRHPGDVRRELSPNNELVTRAALFALLEFDPDRTIPLVGRVADALMNGVYKPIRSKKALSACLWMLGQIGTEPAAQAIGRIRRRLSDKNLIKQADKALAELGKALDLPADQMLEMAMADHGIGPDGCRVVEAEGYRVELKVVASNKAVASTTGPDGKTVRGVSKKFKALDGMDEIAAEIEAAVKDIAKILPEARHRIEASWRDGRTWRFSNWKSLLADNGLLHTLVSKLIWVIETPDGPRAALWRDGAWTDSGGNRVEHPAGDSTVSLWHPLDAAPEETAAWRERLAELRIRQPFAQAWRPVYVLTDAERQTRTYSNRFSAHVLEQAPVMGILKKRGWIAYNRTMQGNSEAHERVQVIMPHHGVSAQFWVAGVGDRIQEGKAAEAGGELYAFIATDRLCFYGLDAETGDPAGDPLPLEEVPARALCEAMYDIDHVVGRTSIGADRHWKDRGAFAQYPVNEQADFETYRQRYTSGATSGLARSRRDFLRSIVPALSISEQLEAADDLLIVDGRLNTYKIHYGSGNILIAPNDRYLCIVPGKRDASAIALPYEGDEILSLILSKALLLAADDKITDPVIVNQIS